MALMMPLLQVQKMLECLSHQDTRSTRYLLLPTFLRKCKSSDPSATRHMNHSLSTSCGSLPRWLAFIHSTSLFLYLARCQYSCFCQMQMLMWRNASQSWQLSLSKTASDHLILVQMTTSARSDMKQSHLSFFNSKRTPAT